MVVAGRTQDDAVSQADLLGALTSRRQEDFRRRRVRVLFEKVMLDLPGEVDAEAVGELNLVERVLKELQLAPIVPGSRQLVFVEDAKLHRSVPFFAARWRAGRCAGEML